jgi:hypothetical protein
MLAGMPPVPDAELCRMRTPNHMRSYLKVEYQGTMSFRNIALRTHPSREIFLASEFISCHNWRTTCLFEVSGVLGRPFFEVIGSGVFSVVLSGRKAAKTPLVARPWQLSVSQGWD